MIAADRCPKDCTHETFEYCAASGTHCDKHCVCPCRLCTQEHARRAEREVPS